MSHRCLFPNLATFFLMAFACAAPGAESVLPNTKPLTTQGDLFAQMVAGIDRFLMGETERSVNGRPAHWKPDFSSRAAYEKSIEPNRRRFRQYLGAVDERVPFTALAFVSSSSSPAKVAETEAYSIHAVRWPVFEGVFGEGLLLEPKTPPLARVIAVPDADQTPEMIAGLAPGLAPESQFARRLAENGCQVLVPVLISRQDTWSGNGALQRFTNQPHREWIYRQAFEMGRHIIGYEVQKILAAADWLARENGFPASGSQPAQAKPFPVLIGLVGYAEGGLLALYSAALDTRIEATLVSGYFDSRQRLWEEPIYRNIFGLLREFGDAEIASLVAPRALIVEQSEVAKIERPPPPREGRQGGAPGKWETPDFNSVEMEVARANALIRPWQSAVRLVHGNEGMSVGPISERALELFLNSLRVPRALVPAGKPPSDSRLRFDPGSRQQRQVEELVEHTQKLLRHAEAVRDSFFWKNLATNSGTTGYASSLPGFRSNFWDQVIGRFPKADPASKSNPRSRQIYDEARWTGYDVVLDVWPDVHAWGILLLPKDLKAGERRPVVVCQHGSEGVPADTITAEQNTQAYGFYKSFSARLADRGFIVFAPHNPYRGGDRFRSLQRKANPLGKSLFSIILAQHDRILDWLGEQPFVDPERIGFYGLSSGGVTAMKVPALLERYALSICSAHFNDWIRKNATVDSSYSYLFTGEYDMPEFNLGQTFNHAEMAALIAPRPFMVERGHEDGVGPDEWVEHEYAKVRRLYTSLGLPERTAIEFFNGAHAINGEGAFKFLHQHLRWPEPK